MSCWAKKREFCFRRRRKMWINTKHLLTPNHNPSPLAPPCASVPVSGVWSEAHECSSLQFSRFVALNEKLSPQKSWRKAWKKKAWVRSLFGRTLEPSTASRGVEQWIGLLRVFLAKAIPLQAADLDRKTTETFGRIQLESLGKSSQIMYFSKMYPVSSPQMRGDLCPLSSTDFKKWVTKLRAVCLQRRKSAQRTRGSGCLSSGSEEKWYTNNTDDRVSKNQDRNLGSQAQMWPTCKTARGDYSYSGGDHDKIVQNLQGATRNWPTTTTTRDSKDTGDMTNVETNCLLGREVLEFPKPLDGFPSSHPARTIGTHGLSAFYSTKELRRLSPRFTWWLMGWPTTVLPGYASPGMGSLIYKRRMHLQLCGLLSSTAKAVIK